MAAFAMLVFLLSHPRGCTRVEITDALWPDVPPGQARNNFHVTLHHLPRHVSIWDTIVGHISMNPFFSATLYRKETCEFSQRRRRSERANKGGDHGMQCGWN